MFKEMLKSPWLGVLQAILIVICTWTLAATDAYFMPYLLVSVSSLICLFKNQGGVESCSMYKIWVTVVFSMLFALMITFANYGLWDTGRSWDVVKFFVLMLGSFTSFANILSFIACRKHISYNTPFKMDHRKVFLFTFLLIVIINSAILFLCKYPGFLTMDSVLQVKQIIDGVYTNSHPFYHTLVLKLCISIGLTLFGTMNAAVATYMIFQICFMAMSFAFAVMTMKEIGAPKWLVFALVAFYTFMPYHMVYSITLWKDVIFGGLVMLYTVFLYRILKEVGNGKLNMIGFILSGLGFCLFRSNGWFAFVGGALLFLLLFKGRQKKLTLVMAAIVVVSFVLKHPVLRMLYVAQPDIAESLSIPIQQVARDIVENKDFTKEQYYLLNQLADVERIPETYLWYISDPMKDLMREKNYQQVLSKYKKEYIKLYISRLSKHPWTYVKAWIDQTKGYWNSGYQYWIWCLYTDGKDIGIHSMVYSERLNNIFNHTLSHFLKFKICQPLVSIGLFVWLMLMQLYIAFIRKDKQLVMLSIPSLMVVASLLLATPVFCEFRYAYAVFCSLPVIWILTLYHQNESNIIDKKINIQKK